MGNVNETYQNSRHPAEFTTKQRADSTRLAVGIDNISRAVDPWQPVDEHMLRDFFNQVFTYRENADGKAFELNPKEYSFEQVGQGIQTLIDAANLLHSVSSVLKE